jgi:hypothetical protein
MITACYILHYGVEWLYWSVRSVVDSVDRVNLFYTPFPSHGHGTNLVCPETRDQLREALIPLLVHDYDIRWFDCPDRFPHEGAHRTYAVNTCFDDGADKIVVVDADEIWDSEVLYKALKESYSDNRSYRIGMRHFWRSTKWVCDDAAAPTRIIVRDGNPTTEGYLPGKVLHMGYAQTPEIIRYKQDIHGHKAEWRQGWFENIFLPWKPGVGDVHPTNLKYWDPVEYKDDGLLEYLIGDHPQWGKDLIV